MERLQNNIKEYGNKLEQLRKLMKTMKGEQEGIKNVVNNWEEKQKGIVEDWHRRNNLLIFGIDEDPHESYFNTIKTSEDFLTMRIKADIMNWHLDSASRIGISGS
jgi:hypothetical protein